VDGKNINIKFVLALIIGDNLGLNEILGYFRQTILAEHVEFTRIKNGAFAEDKTLLRTESTYNDDIQEENQWG
jgi:hypothetical protein